MVWVFALETTEECVYRIRTDTGHDGMDASTPTPLPINESKTPQIRKRMSKLMRAQALDSKAMILTYLGDRMIKTPPEFL